MARWRSCCRAGRPPADLRAAGQRCGPRARRAGWAGVARAGGAGRPGRGGRQPRRRDRAVRFPQPRARCRCDRAVHGAEGTGRTGPAAAGPAFAAWPVRARAAAAAGRGRPRGGAARARAAPGPGD
ncbi:hypothetical protein G6F22_017774 [Rhizopus arrhizus]|nr:hypothetical protein G6F22_017774 [Rhizopus arrhizus]